MTPKKNLIKVPLLHGTIPHEQWCKDGAAKVLIKPAAAGTGEPPRDWTAQARSPAAVAGSDAGLVVAPPEVTAAATPCAVSTTLRVVESLEAAAATCAASSTALGSVLP